MAGISWRGRGGRWRRTHPGPLASGLGGVAWVLRARRGATGGTRRYAAVVADLLRGAGSAPVQARAARVAVYFHGIQAALSIAIAAWRCNATRKSKGSTWCNSALWIRLLNRSPC